MSSEVKKFLINNLFSVKQPLNLLVQTFLTVKTTKSDVPINFLETFDYY